MKSSTSKYPHTAFDETLWFDAGGNKLRLLHSATDRLETLFSIIEQAQVSLKICFYIFEDDRTGQKVLGALIAACVRGITVELIVDSFGSKGTPTKFFDPFKQAGGHFSIFSPRFSSSYFVRNHQKMVIADDRRALIGGFNIADSYFDPHDDSQSAENSWEDLGLLIEGGEPQKLSKYYTSLSRWVLEDNGNIRSLRKIVREWDACTPQFHWLLGGPSNRLSHWAVGIKNDLEKGKRLDLVTAYFSPGQGLIRRIGGISKRGGQSRILLAGRSDNKATIGASRLLYGYLLKRGTKILEYQPRRLHTKLVIVDDAVYIGSANFDLRSLFINVEMMLRIEDKAFADHARLLVDKMSIEALAITPALHKSRRSLLNRLRWTLSYFFVNTLDYTVTRRLNFGIKK